MKKVRFGIGLGLGCLLMACPMPARAAEPACDIGQFQGSWRAADGRDEHFTIGPRRLDILAGTATSHIPLTPARDVAMRGVAQIRAAMPNVASVYAADLKALGGGAGRVCVLQVATPGGSMAFLPERDGLLRLEESRADAPIAQHVRRAGANVAGPKADFSQPPR